MRLRHRFHDMNAKLSPSRSTDGKSWFTKRGCETFKILQIDKEIAFYNGKCLCSQLRAKKKRGQTPPIAKEASPGYHKIYWSGRVRKWMCKDCQTSNTQQNEMYHQDDALLQSRSTHNYRSPSPPHPQHTLSTPLLFNLTTQTTLQHKLLSD